MLEKARLSIIEVIKSPLGFFVLALLIVEAFIGLVLIKSDLTEPHKFFGMNAGIFLFVILVIVVTLLVWHKPKHLIYTEEGHMHSEDLQHLPQDSYQLVKMENLRDDKHE